MKFLVSGTPKNIQIPPEMGVQLYQAAIEWVQDRIDDGRIECHYAFPGGGGFAIVNHDTHELLSDEIMNYPLYNFFDWDVRALTDWHHTYKSGIKLFQKMAVMV